MTPRPPPPAALDHRRLAVIDPPGGAQPMTVAADGATRLVRTYSRGRGDPTGGRPRAGTELALGLDA
ncbi:hypothetical protein [Streptomyces buecherae]|uniref:hypothetical protein n=1 Tax=Streptomyces buecherae TaxID=2763006 RepID=UPI0037954168